MASTASTSSSSTQKYLDVFDVTNDLIILNDGSVALVITVSAMNFGLLSEDEQDATIYSYAALLNSLSYPVQIVIRSQPKDVTNYLKLVEMKENETLNPLYKKRIREYRSFIESMVQEQNVLDKKFYFVIPLSGVDMGLSTASVIPGKKNSKAITSYDKSFIIDKAKTNLEPRRDHLIDQLARIGLYSRQLTTQELIQMLYNSYNPESFEGLQVTDTKNYTTPLVQAQILGDLTMMDTTQSTPPVAPTADTTPATPTQPTMADISAPTSTPVAPATAPTATPGITTPADMGSSITPPTSPVEPSTPSMQSSPSAAVTPASATPTPSVSVTESPIVSTPPASPAGATATPAPSSAALPEQELINQTLNQLGSTPVTPSPVSSEPTTPAAPTTPATEV